MTVLIDELKKEHLEIIGILNEVKELGVLTREGQAKLMSVKVALLAHIKKEDERLYPELRKEAEHNKQIKNALTLCAIDMENVSRVVWEFFEKYAEGVIDEEFEGKFEDLLIALDKRIKNEEDVLYEQYDWINQ